MLLRRAPSTPVSPLLTNLHKKDTVCRILSAADRVFYKEEQILKIKNPKDKFFTLCLLAAVLGVYLLLKIPCPTQHFLHLPCPSCGMTRAWLAILRGDLHTAFRMHGMFWSVPLLGLYYLYDGKLFRNKWADGTVLTLLALGFAANWIYHLIYNF